MLPDVGKNLLRQNFNLLDLRGELEIGNLVVERLNFLNRRRTLLQNRVQLGVSGRRLVLLFLFRLRLRLRFLRLRLLRRVRLLRRFFRVCLLYLVREENPQYPVGHDRQNHCLYDLPEAR